MVVPAYPTRKAHLDMIHLSLWILGPILIGTIVGFLVCVALANPATTVKLHRVMAHKALTLAGAVDFSYRAVIWITTGIRPGEWVAVHRVHHRYTDVEGDPHSPYLLTINEVEFHNGRVYREWLNQHPNARQMFKDTHPDWWDLKLFDRSRLGLFIGISLLAIVTYCSSRELDYGLLGAIYLTVMITAVASVSHALLYLWLGGCVNGRCHWLNGYQNYKNNLAKNKRWVALLTSGEGLHNNHHGDQNDYRLWRKWWEMPFDMGWWLHIKPLMVLGLARPRQLRVAAAEAA